MKRKQQIVGELLPNKSAPEKMQAYATAPCHLSLCKPLGKKDAELNIPEVSSLSLGMPFGVKATVSIASHGDEITIHNLSSPLSAKMLQIYTDFLNLSRPSADFYYKIDIESTQSDYVDFIHFEFEASLAAIAIAFREMFAWNLDRLKLSVLLRLTNTHACRCLYSGFVEWKQGSSSLGWDSYGYPIAIWWETLQVGFLPISPQTVGHDKNLDQTVQITSSLYSAWPQTAQRDLTELKEAILYRQFERFGHVVESNSLSFHALLQTTTPPFLLWQPQTVQTMHQIWNMRSAGIPLFFSLDAGSHLKFLFLKQDKELMQSIFPYLQIYTPFSTQ